MKKKPASLRINSDSLRNDYRHLVLPYLLPQPGPPAPDCRLFLPRLYPAVHPSDVEKEPVVEKYS